MCHNLAHPHANYLPQLGDPERRAASSAAYELTGLLAAHPNMKVYVLGILSLKTIDAINQYSSLCKILHAKHFAQNSLLASLNCFNLQMVVIDEVDSFLFRPHVGLRAKYQAVCNC